MYSDRRGWPLSTESFSCLPLCVLTWQREALASGQRTKADIWDPLPQPSAYIRPSNVCRCLPVRKGALEYDFFLEGNIDSVHGTTEYQIL